MLDRQSQLEQLHRKSEDLHGCLPGASTGFANKEVDEIYAQVRLIEEEIGAAMKRKAVERELHSGYASSAPSFEDRSVGPDTVSVSSAGGPSLALDVQVTAVMRLQFFFFYKDFHYFFTSFFTASLIFVILCCDVNKKFIFSSFS